MADNASDQPSAMDVLRDTLRNGNVKLPPQAGIGTAIFGLFAEGEDRPTLAGALWRQYDPLGSLLSNKNLQDRLLGQDSTPISTDELITALDGDGMWGHEDRFLEVETRGQYDSVKRQIQQELADREIIESSGTGETFLTGLAVGAANPINWLPVGWAARGILAGERVAQVAGATAVAGGVTEAINELALHPTQELRTVEESAINVGAGTVLAGILGGGAAAIASPTVRAAVGNTLTSWRKTPDWNQRLFEAHQEAYQAIVDEIANNPQGRRIKGGGRAASVGQMERRDEAFDALQAAEARLEQANDLRMATAGPLEWARTAVPRVLGKWKPEFLDPIDFITKRSSTVEGKKALEQIMEIPVLLNKNLDGKPTAIAATTEMDGWVGLWSEFHNAMWGGNLREGLKTGASRAGVADLGNSYYTQARRAGFKGDFEAFDRAVFKAVVNGHADPDGNAAVTLAAQHVKKITEAERELANKAGYAIPKDAPKYALGYVSRHYIVPNVVGKDGQGTHFRLHAEKAYYSELYADLWQRAKAENRTITRQELSGIKRRAKTLGKQAYDRITRKDGGVEQGFRFTDSSSVNSTIGAGSSLHERVVPLDDSWLLANGYIDGRITDVLNTHMRRAIPELLLSQRFKTATGLPDASLEQSVVPKIVKEYDEFLAVAKTPQERQQILNERNNTLSVLRGLRDEFLRGPKIGNSGWESIERGIAAVKLYQAERLMGGLVWASIPDVAAIQMRHGFAKPMTALGRKFHQSVSGLLTGIPKTKSMQDELVRMGTSVEWATNAGLAAQADLLSPFADSNKFQRFLFSTSRAFSVTNFSVAWNETWKSVAGRAAMDTILEVAERGFDRVPEAKRRQMALLGLGKSEVNRIGAAWRSQSQGLHDGMLRAAYPSSWDDQEAARLFGAALQKDNASSVIRPRTGDTGTLWNTPILSLLTQFQKFQFSFALRALTLGEQRVIHNGPLSRDALRVYASLGNYVALGMLSSYLLASAKDLLLPDDEKKHVKQLTENPGQWISTGIDRSGVAGLFGYYNTYWERLGGIGVTRALQNAMDDPSLAITQKGRWLERDPLQVLMGPTVSQTADLFKTGKHIWNNALDGEQELRKSDARTVREAAPFQNHILLRYLFDEAQKVLAEDVMGLTDE
jgi:hypothetical protein